MRQLTIAASNYRLGSYRGTKREDFARLGGLGTNWKSVFYLKLTRMTIPKILSVSPLTTKEHPYKVKKKICKAVFS